MLDAHISKDGTSMLICQMSDRHLANTIRVYCRLIDKARRLNQITRLSPLEMRIYGLPKVNEDTVGEAIRRLIEKMVPYLAEAYIRPDLASTDLVDQVRLAIGRTGALPAAPIHVMSPQYLLNANQILANEGFEDEDWERDEWARDPDEGDR